MISQQSRRLSLAYQSQMLLFFYFFSLFPLVVTDHQSSSSSLSLPIPCASPRRSPRPYLVSRGPSASTRLWRRGKYVRTPIGAISISPDSNLGSLERGECASFAMHVTRATCRRMRDKKKKQGEGMIREKRKGRELARRI